MAAFCARGELAESRKARTKHPVEDGSDRPRQSDGIADDQLARGRARLATAWLAETGAANIGFNGQKRLLEQVLAWLPTRVSVLLSADRFYPSIDLFEWLHRQGCQYRLRLKSTNLADSEYGGEGPLGNGRRA